MDAPLEELYHFEIDGQAMSFTVPVDYVSLMITPKSEKTTVVRIALKLRRKPQRWLGEIETALGKLNTGEDSEG